MFNVKFLILCFLVILFQNNCKSQEKPAPVTFGPEVNANTVIRKIEIDQIKVGDKMIKAAAVLGKATDISHKANGSEHTWWLTPSAHSDSEYETLKTKPSNVTGAKFIKLVTDSKGIIIDKMMEL